MHPPAEPAFAPAGVTRILVSHFHGDHITAQNEAVFPNAQIFVPEAQHPLHQWLSLIHI